MAGAEAVPAEQVLHDHLRVDESLSLQVVAQAGVAGFERCLPLGAPRIGIEAVHLARMTQAGVRRRANFIESHASDQLRRRGGRRCCARRRTSQRDGLSDDVVIPLEQSAGGHHVDSGTEERAEFVDEVDLVQQGSPRFELGEEAHVAGRIGDAPSEPKTHTA